MFCFTTRKLLISTTALSPCVCVCVCVCVQRCVEACPDRSAVEYEGAIYTYRRIDVLSSRIAHWASTLSDSDHTARSLQPRDTVCIMMENR